MSKTGPLSVAEKFYISKKYKEMTLEDLSKEMKRTQSIIQEYITEYEAEHPDEFNVASQMSHGRGTTVMTQNASEMLDELRPRRKPGRPDCITEIKKKNE